MTMPPEYRWRKDPPRPDECPSWWWRRSASGFKMILFLEVEDGVVIGPGDGQVSHYPINLLAKGEWCRIPEPAAMEGRHCFACDGAGEKHHGAKDTPRKCEVCRGKGFWTNEDIRAHHLAYPEVCRRSCGATHRDPLPSELTGP